MAEIQLQDVTPMTALTLSSMIKAGEVSVEEVVKKQLEIIKQEDDKYNCYITVWEEAAIARAKEVQMLIDEGKLADSPLAGVPIAIKDNICTKGELTTCASKMLSNFKPPYNAEVIERLEAAGAVIIGKVNMDEFAMGSTTETSYYGATKNPRGVEYVPGGSSGGAAAAVAAREAVIALGSDTGGSIRQPSSFCGVTGIKPTYGTVSRYGLIAYASSLDQIGPIANSVADCASVLEVIAGHDGKDSTSVQTESY
ncbi:amidase, partial [Anaerosporobacter sp.]|uniref:amidase n=1 Tax=Anaerosporobacter sp. TaxID=1872529 RepID=UPI00286F7872